MNKKHLLLFFLWMFCQLQSQNIKTIQLRPANSKQFSPIVSLGKTLELSFDDLEADNKQYQYKIEHMTYDWKPSTLQPNQYLNGFQENDITNISNSFNTLQDYTHYTFQIPNKNVSITKSGNYLISVLDEYDEVVFTRRCVFFEPLVKVGVNVLRSLNVSKNNKQQTVQFVVNHKNYRINDVSQIKTVILKNNNWNNSIKNILPRQIKKDILIYNHLNKINFLGGNEYYFFDSKNIQNTSLNIAQTELKDVWHHFLYADKPLYRQPYRNNQDINGQFIIRTLNGKIPASEADYAITHFTLVKDEPYKNKDVYIYGAFNNFKISEEYRMQYNEEKKYYFSKLLLKQGFYNYTYVTSSNKKAIHIEDINGSFSDTENEYTVIIYNRSLAENYDKVIGVGKGYFNLHK